MAIQFIFRWRVRCVSELDGRLGMIQRCLHLEPTLGSGYRQLRRLASVPKCLTQLWFALVCRRSHPIDHLRSSREANPQFPQIRAIIGRSSLKHYISNHILTTFHHRLTTFSPVDFSLPSSSNCQRFPPISRTKPTRNLKLTTTHHKPRRLVLSTAKWSIHNY